MTKPWLYDRALKIREKALGPDHPSTLDTLYNMALLHTSHGDKVKAKEVLDKCLDGHIEAYGPEHQYTQEVKSLIQQMSDSQ